MQRPPWPLTSRASDRRHHRCHAARACLAMHVHQAQVLTRGLAPCAATAQESGPGTRRGGGPERAAAMRSGSTVSAGLVEGAGHAAGTRTPQWGRMAERECPIGQARPRSLKPTRAAARRQLLTRVGKLGEMIHLHGEGYPRDRARCACSLGRCMRRCGRAAADSLPGAANLACGVGRACAPCHPRLCAPTATFGVVPSCAALR